MKITVIIKDYKKIKIHFNIPINLKGYTNVSFTDSALKFEKDGDKIEFTIHGFLSIFNISLNITTEVGYIGKTINPESRPIDGKHRGLTGIVYEKSKKGYDILIFYNQFKILTEASLNNYLNINIGSSYIDDIGSENESLLLEKIMIIYFKLNTFQSLDNESRILNKSLLSLARELNIVSIKNFMEIEGDCEYFIFKSEKVKEKKCHIIKCSFFEDKVIVESVNNLDRSF